MPAQELRNPTERAAGRPDALDLYETLMVSANRIRFDADMIRDSRGYGATDAISEHRRTARAEAKRIIAALDAFEQGERT